jgi:hypothetical protein
MRGILAYVMERATHRQVNARRAPGSHRPPARPPEPMRPLATSRKPIVLPSIGFPANPAPAAGVLTAYRKRRVRTLLAFVVLSVVVAVAGQFAHAASRSAPAYVSAPPSAEATPKAASEATAKPAVPMAGTSGIFAYAGGTGPVLGTAGPVRRFRLAVEKPARPGAPAEFARAVDQVLGDPRSWIAAHRFRLQRVPPSVRAEFTIFLASSATSRRMCLRGGLETGGFTSCRLPAEVIVNDARWEGAVPRYGAPVGVYRAYAVNHEVGHQLGHGHEACPGAGRPAPVMMQQTYGLKGCSANAWPYVNGRRYAGPPAP